MLLLAIARIIPITSDVSFGRRLGSRSAQMPGKFRPAPSASTTELVDTRVEIDQVALPAAAADKLRMEDAASADRVWLA